MLDPLCNKQKGRFPVHRIAPLDVVAEGAVSPAPAEVSVIGQIEAGLWRSNLGYVCVHLVLCPPAVECLDKFRLALNDETIFDTEFVQWDSSDDVDEQTR